MQGPGKRCWPRLDQGVGEKPVGTGTRTAKFMSQSKKLKKLVVENLIFYSSKWMGWDKELEERYRSLGQLPEQTGW